MNASFAPPPAAIVPPHDNRGLFQIVPVEILRKTLSFCDIPSLVLLAASSKHYQRFVFTDCPFLWTDIDFGKVKDSQAATLTDDHLHSLLMNVNARNVTTSLSIMGCTSIRGTGLAALMFSWRLEIIELHRSQEEIQTVGETGLNDEFIISVLRSMSPVNPALRDRAGPSGLKIVKIRKQNDTDDTHTLTHTLFSLDFVAAIERQLVDQRIACEQCQQALVDRIPPEKWENHAAFCFCGECKTIFCGYGGCKTVSECEICMKRMCDDCGLTVCCDDCGHIFCENCRPLKSCVGTACAGAEYCPSCRAVKSCELCERNLCIECDPVGYCGFCEKDHCRECNESRCLRLKKRASSPSSESDMPPPKRLRV